MNKFKKAFTLAEILVTITVIGVITTLTIPSVISNRNEAEFVAKSKKFMSSMEEAYRLSRLDNGPPSFWKVPNEISQDSAEKLAPYIVPYLNIVKDYGTTKCSTAANDNCGGYKEKIKYLSGKNASDYMNTNYYYKLMLADGTFLWFRGIPNATQVGEEMVGNGYCRYTEGETKNICASIFFDVNGPRKPNTIGKDVFYVHITTKGIEPDRRNDCILDSRSEGRGCISHVLRNDDMKYPKQ